MAKKKPAKNAAKNAKNNPKKGRYSQGLTDLTGRDGFYRNKVTTGRWSYGMDVFRSNFTKLIGLNLIMLIFIAPIVYFLFVRYASQISYATLSPFTANVGVGYAPVTDLVGLEQSITFLVNRDFFWKLPLLSVWLSVGLSGGMFIMRNICWGEDASLFKDLITGIRRHFFAVLIATILISLIVSSVFIAISYIDYLGAIVGGKTWYQIVLIVLMIIAAVFACIWYFNVLSLTMAFKTDLFTLFKDGFVLSYSLLPLNVFYLVFAALPFGLLMLGSSFIMLGILALVMIGMSYTMLVWTNYSHWVFDKFIYGSIKSVYRPTEEEIKRKQEREEAKKQIFGQDDGFDTVDGGMAAAYSVNAKPVSDEDKAVETLPENFTFADLKRLKESKAELKKDAEEYASDPASYNKAHGAAEEAKTEEKTEEKA